MKLELKELKIIAHTLGIKYFEIFKPEKQDKILPEEFYRNHFCASVNHSEFPILSELHNKKIMNCWTQFDNIYFGVTDLGIEKFRKEFNELVN